ncbi:hypothetical protein TRFO_22747 [Tritrichomonas foetus]|uniref:Uncharacterized protein n=1 Tax=Tritrichomonas foetus TaxID=1144522 RepID=A0A1J4KH40_9EUKA|nr:hypothetical protein TRFO_22747 [Tritrichomonas foetus]|eukprot:OHT08661.1 hypothetical protein TRFO_22747 [Tritrichomonas foetus]
MPVRKAAPSTAASHATSHRSTRSTANSKYSQDHIIFSRKYRLKDDEQPLELATLHSPDNKIKPISRKWVSPQLIKPILNRMLDLIDEIDIPKHLLFELSRQIRALQHIVSYNNSSNISLSTLHDEFWSGWQTFKSNVSSAIQPEGAASFVRSQLSKASDHLTLAENSLPENCYNQQVFDYIFDKMDIVYNSLRTSPDIHSIKRVYTVVSQNMECFFVDEETAHLFLKRIRRCVKAINTINEVNTHVFEEINEAELSLKDLIPETLKKRRGKSVSNDRKIGPPSFVKNTTLRSLKTVKFASERRAVTPPARKRHFSSFVSLTPSSSNKNRNILSDSKSTTSHGSAGRRDRGYARSSASTSVRRRNDPY